MPYLYTLGVDPGTTTGLSMTRFDLDNDGKPEQVWSDQLDWQAAADAIEFRAGSIKALTSENERSFGALCGEKFLITPNSSRRGQAGIEDALGMLGHVRRVAHLSGLDFITESASSAKNLISDDILKSLDLFSPGHNHSNDSTRQSMLYAIKKKALHTKWLVR